MIKHIFPKLVTKATQSVLDKFERTISGWRAVRGAKAFTLFISNKDMDDIIKIVKFFEDWCLLIDGATETVKHEIKQQESGFLGAMMAPIAFSLIQPVASSLMNAITGKGFTRAGKRQNVGFFQLLTLS